MRIIEAIRRLFSEPEEADLTAAPAQARLIIKRRTRPPGGLEWRPVHDQKLNQELYSRRVGMLNFEIIELWAPGWPEARKVFSLSADNFIHSNHEILWRPIHCPEPEGDWRWCN